MNIWTVRLLKNITEKTKLSYVIQSGVIFLQKLVITSICLIQKFSVTIYESSSISVTQTLVEAVNYFNFNKHDAADALLDTVVAENGASLVLTMFSNLPYMKEIAL